MQDEPLTLSEQVGSNSEIEDAPSVETLGKAYDLLQKLLGENDGVASSIQLKRTRVSQASLPEEVASQCIKELQFLDAHADARVGRKNAKTYHSGRSFFSKEKYEEALAETEKEAEAKGQEAEETPETEEREKETPQNRQEEARLGVYVKTALETIYDSDHALEDHPYVFDVHSDRPGSAFENVDLLAVHWRSENTVGEKTVDLVSIEVKLEFSAKAVHEACSYTRFSHRVWVACAVNSEPPEAALELRSKDPGLFDYAVARGIGILACRHAKGRSYEIFPIHWPVWQDPEAVEKDRFVERYRSHFEQAGVAEKRKRSARY